MDMCLSQLIKEDNLAAHHSREDLFNHLSKKRKLRVPFYCHLTTSPIATSNRDSDQIDIYLTYATTRNCVIVTGVLPEQLRDPMEPVASCTKAESVSKQANPSRTCREMRGDTCLAIRRLELLLHCNPVALRKKSAVPSPTLI